MSGPDRITTSYEALPDEQLMVLVRDSDRRAFDELYNRYRAPLFNYICRTCGSRDVGDDLFQEAWLRVMRSAHQYRSDQLLKPWMFRIAHNLVVDYFRSRSRKREEPVENYDDLPGNNATPEHEIPDTQLDLQWKVDRLMALIEQLPEEQREVFVLRREFDESLERIAELTDTNVETVRSRLRYAVDKLRRALGENAS